MNDTLSVSEAAQALGISPDAVRKRINRGTLQAVKVDDVWRVTLPRHVDATPGAIPPAALDAVQHAVASSAIDDLTATIGDLWARLDSSLPPQASDAMQATITRQDEQIAFLRARLEARDATIDDLVRDLRHERQQVDMLEAGRLGMIEARGRETDAVQAPVSHETPATDTSSHVDTDAVPVSPWARLLRLITRRE